MNRKVPETPTADLPLVGAEGYTVLWNQREQLSQSSGLHLTRIEHLLRRYGGEIRRLLAEIAERPELAAPIDGADDYLLVEAWYAAAWEGAQHMDDILTRRTRISIETFDRGVAAASHIAPVVGDVLSWSAEDRAREIDHYTKRVEAERESQTQADDLTADAARLGAPDVRTGFSG